MYKLRYDQSIVEVTKYVRQIIIPVLFYMAVITTINGQSSDRISIPSLSDCCTSKCEVIFMLVGKDTLHLGNCKEVCIAADEIKEWHMRSISVHRDGTGTTAYIKIPHRIERRLLHLYQKESNIN